MTEPHAPIGLAYYGPLVWIGWGLIGMLVGSFLNVCIHRFPLEDQSITNPRRSRCPSCGSSLTWSENIPILSWVLQRGRCRSCSAPISVRYPLVEATNATLWLVALGVAGVMQPQLWLTWSIVLSGLLVATAVDIDCFQIPDEISLGGMLVGVLACILVPELHGDGLVANRFSAGPEGLTDWRGALASGICGLAIGAGILLGIGWIGKLMYGQEAMGLGDVKLLGAGGLFIGPVGVLLALLIAAVLASLFGLLLLARLLLLTRSRAVARGRKDPIGRSVRVARLAGRYVAFGPFLALGIGIVLLGWDDVTSWIPWAIPS